jgi:oligogalacturonide lyase
MALGVAAAARNGVAGGGRGKWFPSEKTSYRDADTGREVWQMTNTPQGSSNLYFTAQSFTRDSEGLVFQSARSSPKTELYWMELKSGRFKQVTEVQTGAYGACVAPKANSVAYMDNGALWYLNLATLDSRRLFEVPAGYSPNLLSIDDAGRYVAFAYARTLEKPLGPDQTHHSVLVRVATDGSGFVKVHEEDFWISHVLINPRDPETIVFCHEGGWAVVAQRLWAIQADGTGLRKVRVEEEPAVEIGHEFWTEYGAALGYHGSYKRRSFIGRVRKDGTGQREYTVTAPAGHTTATEDGRMVLGDGTFDFPYICLYRMKGSVAIADPICHSLRMKADGIHAHANFSSDGKYVVFGGEKTGHPEVYVVKAEG